MMKFIRITILFALIAFAISCSKPKNTSYTPSDSFVIGDAAFFERFETKVRTTMHTSQDDGGEWYSYYFFYGSNVLNIDVMIHGRKRDEFYSNQRYYKANHWFIYATDVLSTVFTDNYLSTVDSVNQVTLIQRGAPLVSPLPDTIYWSEAQPYEIIKTYSFGDTVDWSLDEDRIDDYYNQSISNSGFIYNNRNTSTHIFEHSLSSSPSYSDGNWSDSYETNIANDLSENKFIVCKFKFQPENPPAGFDDEIEKLMVIEIGLTQDSIINVVNVYNEKYLPK